MPEYDVSGKIKVIKKPGALATIFFILLVWFFLVIGCESGNQGGQYQSESSPKSGRTTGNNVIDRSKPTLIGQLKIGKLTVGMQIDNKGEISFTTGWSPVVNIPLGFGRANASLF